MSYRAMLQAASASFLAGALCAACYHYRVRPPRPDPATEYRSRTTVALIWGAVQPDVRAADCTVSNAIDEVRVTTNVAYTLVTVVTLGLVAPLQVEWRCAKQQTGIDTTRVVGERPAGEAR